MRAWFVKAPWWQLSLLLGSVVFLVRFAADRFLEDESWTESAISAAAGALVFGLVIGPILAGQNRRAREALGTDDPDVLRRAFRTARRGPIPEEPVHREQARRVALVLRDQVQRQRPLFYAALLVLVACAVIVAVLLESALLLLLVLAPVVLLAGVRLLLLRRFERRAELLRDPSGRDAGAGGMLAG